MGDYEVIVVGAGPAGGQCARALTLAGRKVLLLEKAPNFAVNDFSSGGAPLSVMTQFQLPSAVVGSQWKRLYVSSTEEEHCFESVEPLGVVFDFRALRSFLAEQAHTTLLGTPYISHRQTAQGVHVQYKGGEAHCRVLVDATGTDRRLLGSADTVLMPAAGIEHLIEVDDLTYRRFADQLSFYLGHHWMPQGYGWIFPMQENHLKVGVARYYVGEHHVPYETSLLVYLEQILQRCIGGKGFPLLDKHGKTIHYAYGRKDRHVDGAVIAIGDAVSTINPIGGEGVRHGMVSGQLASLHIAAYLNGDAQALDRYAAALKRYTRGRWWASEFLMYELYRQPRDARIDHFVRSLKGFSTPQLMDLLFEYRYLEFARLVYRYLVCIFKN